MPLWAQLVLAILAPALAGVFAYVGAMAGVKADVRWLKDWLARHDTQIAGLHSRLSRLRDRIPGG